VPGPLIFPFMGGFQFAPGYPSGRRNMGHCTQNTGTTISVVANRHYAHPFIVGKQTTWDTIGVEVTTAGAGGSLARLGIYEAQSDGTPGALVLDAGTVLVDATGDREISITQELSAGFYFLTFVSDGTPVIRAAILGETGAGWLGSASVSSSSATIFRAHTFGALPDPYGAASYTGGHNSPGLYLET
jgi:hypothetical protein